MTNKDIKRRIEKRKKRQKKQLLARQPLQMVREQATEHECGECQACCEAVGVHELKKSVWTRCQHQCSIGCEIYEHRPASCQTYTCLWRVGVLKGGIENRPDQLGIIFDLRRAGSQDLISAWETREGAADEPKVKEMLEEMAKVFIIYVRRYKSNKRRILGPREKLKDTIFTEYE